MIATALPGLLASCQEKAPKVEDYSPFQGKWQAVEATSNGEAPPPGMLERISMEFTGTQVSIMGAPLLDYTIDSTVSPGRIDFKNSVHQVGIYQFENGFLKICTGQQDDRPSDFITNPHTDYTFMKLKKSS